MPVRDRGPEALATGCPPAEPGHLGVQARLVDEDQSVRVEIRLPLEPGESGGVDVVAVLLARVARLFFTLMPRRRKKRHMVEMAKRAPARMWTNPISSASVMSGYHVFQDAT